MKRLWYRMPIVGVVRHLWYRPPIFGQSKAFMHGIDHQFLGGVKRLWSVGRYDPVMTDSSRLQQHHTTSDDPGQGCKAHEGGIRP